MYFCSSSTCLQSLSTRLMSTRKLNVEMCSRHYKTPFLLNTTTETAWLIFSVTIFHCECLIFMWLFACHCELFKNRGSVSFISVSLASNSNSINVENVISICSHFMCYAIHQSIVVLFFYEKQSSIFFNINLFILIGGWLLYNIVLVQVLNKWTYRLLSEFKITGLWVRKN